MRTDLTFGGSSPDIEEKAGTAAIEAGAAGYTLEKVQGAWKDDNGKLVVECSWRLSLVGDVGSNGPAARAAAFAIFDSGEQAILAEEWHSAYGYRAAEWRLSTEPGDIMNGVACRIAAEPVGDVLDGHADRIAGERVGERA